MRSTRRGGSAPIRWEIGDTPRMRWGAIVLGFLVGCGFRVSDAPGLQDALDGPGGGDGMSGGEGCATPSFSTQVDTCGLALDTDLTLSGNLVTYDTGTHELRVGAVVMAVAHMTLMAKAGDVDAILARDVHLTSGTDLVATGPLPFAIVASGSVTLDDGAAIDVGRGGAGALPVCSSPAHVGGSAAVGGGGGGGGYGDAGGNGGTGNIAVAPGGTGAGSIGMPDGPSGGCPGGSGGIGAASGAAAGGPGGGALYIVAADSITLGGGAVLTAAGGGGRGGGSIGGGGGGGGSGGMIFLEALHVMGPTSQIAANGGGGGEGADGVAGSDGNPGSTSTSRAEGGTGGATNGTDGGRGGSQEQPAGEDVTAKLVGGGGGGGGSVGYIHIKSNDVQLGSVSPAAS